MDGHEDDLKNEKNVMENGSSVSGDIVSDDERSNAWDPDDMIVLEWPGRAQGMCDEQVYW